MTPPSGPDPDLTRKERREQARSERKAMEAAAAQSAQRKRLIQLGGVIGVVVVIIIVIVVASSGGSSGGSGLATGSKKNSTVATVTSLIHGIPQSGNVLGYPNAPVTLQYFGDLECPICREFTLGALPKVIQKYVRTGKVKIEYNSLETATDEQETFRTQQVAAYAAGKQNLAWYFIELFYHEQGQEESGYVTENYLPGPRPAGAGAQSPQLERRAQRSRLRRTGHARRADRQRRGLHRHAVIPHRQERPAHGKARKPQPRRTLELRSDDQQTAFIGRCKRRWQ